MHAQLAQGRSVSDYQRKPVTHSLALAILFLTNCIYAYGYSSEPYAPTSLQPPPNTFSYVTVSPQEYRTITSRKYQDASPAEKRIIDREWEPQQVYIDQYHLNKYAVFGGLSYVNYFSGPENDNFAVTSTETDSLAETTQNTGIGFLLGFQKVNLSQSHKADIESINYGIVFSYDHSSYSGQVYQFQLPLFNNYTYTYSINPFSTLVEAEFVFIPIRKIHTSPFIVAGAGVSLVSLTYNETALPGVPAGLQANNANSWVGTPDIAVGAGLQFDLQKDYFLKTEYLYQYRGNTSTAVKGFVDRVPINLNEQSVSVIAGYRFHQF